MVCKFKKNGFTAQKSVLWGRKFAVRCSGIWEGSAIGGNLGSYFCRFQQFPKCFLVVFMGDTQFQESENKALGAIVHSSPSQLQHHHIAPTARKRNGQTTCTHSPTPDFGRQGAFNTWEIILFFGGAVGISLSALLPNSILLRCGTQGKQKNAFHRV